MKFSSRKIEKMMPIFFFGLVPVGVETPTATMPPVLARPNQPAQNAKGVLNVEFKTINIVFEDELPGTKNDVKSFRNWTLLTGQPAVAFGDVDLAKDKTAFLKKIVDAAQGFENINLNYSGHGIRIETEPGEYGPNKDNSNRPCTPSVTEISYCGPTVIKKPKYEYYIVSDATVKCQTKCLEDNKSDQLQRCTAAIREKAHRIHPFLHCQFGAEDCQKNLRKGDETGLEKCIRDRDACADVQAKISPLESLNQSQTLFMRIGYPTLVGKCNQQENERIAKLTCYNSCVKQYSLSAAEINEALKGKNVFGVIDACHSGGFIEDLNFNNKLMVSSSDADEVSADIKEKGGRAVDYFNQVFAGELCGATDVLDVSINHIFNREITYNLDGGRIQQAQLSTKGTQLHNFAFLNTSKLKCDPQHRLPVDSPAHPTGGRHEVNR